MKGEPENANNEHKVTIQDEKCLVNVLTNSITNGRKLTQATLKNARFQMFYWSNHPTNSIVCNLFFAEKEQSGFKVSKGQQSTFQLVSSKHSLG